MGENLTFVRTPKGGVEGFEHVQDAKNYAQNTGGTILKGKDALGYQLDYDAQGLKGAAAAAGGSSLFTIPKMLVGAFGTPEQQEFLARSNEYHPWAEFGGTFLAPWGAAGKLAGGVGRGLFGLGEAAEAGSIFGRGSIFAEGSALEGAAAHGGAPVDALAGRALESRAIEPVLESMHGARPGVAAEFEGLAGRGFTAEGRAIAEAHPRSFLEAALREGSLNAGVGALNSAGDYMLNERYMDGDPQQDAGSLADAILHGALTGGLLGGAAGAVKAPDHVMDPLHAPKAKMPEAIRGDLEARFRAGGSTAAEAAELAKTAIEHGVAGAVPDVKSYNIVSHLLENHRIKRGLERGEFVLPPTLSGEGDLAKFVDSVSQKAHISRSGGELGDFASHLGGTQGDLEELARGKRATLADEAKRPLTAEAQAVHDAHAYDGFLSHSAAAADLRGATESAKLIERADEILAKNPTSRVARLQALDLLQRAEAVGDGLNLSAEHAALRKPLEHAANGEKFLSALGEHQLADKARRDLGALINESKAGGAINHESAAGLEQSLKQLGLEGGAVDNAVREHYENAAARAIGAESKALDQQMRMLAGLFAGGVASKILGGGILGFGVGNKVAKTVAQAMIDPIGASGTIRKATMMLRYSAADVDRLAQGLAPQAAGKASAMNVLENITPWGKVLWETAPGKTARMVGQTLEDGFRALAPSMPQRAAAGLQIATSIEKHLEEHEPKPVAHENVNPAALANLPPRYNPREVAGYQQRLQAVLDPKATVATFLRTGQLSKEAADSLRFAHPGLVNTLVAKGAAQMAQAPEGERYAMGRKLEVLGGPQTGYFSASSTPSFTAAVQKSYLTFSPQGPGPGGPSGNASPQKNPGPGGAQYAPVTAMKNNGAFLSQTHASPSAALSTSLGRK